MMTSRRFQTLYKLSSQSAFWLILLVRFIVEDKVMAMLASLGLLASIIATAILVVNIAKTKRNNTGTTATCYIDGYNVGVNSTLEALFIPLALIILLKGFAAIAMLIFFEAIFLKADYSDNNINISFLLIGITMFQAKINEKEAVCIGHTKDIEPLIRENVDAIRLTDDVLVIKN